MTTTLSDADIVIVSKDRPLPPGVDVKRQKVTDAIWVEHVLEEKEPLPITKRYNVLDKLPKDGRNFASEHPAHTGSIVYNTTAASVSALATTGDDSSESSVDSSQSDALGAPSTKKTRAIGKTTAPVSGLHARSKPTASAKKSAPATPKTPAKTTASRSVSAASASKAKKSKASTSANPVTIESSSEAPESPATSPHNDKKRKRAGEESDEEQSASLKSPPKKATVPKDSAPINGSPKRSSRQTPAKAANTTPSKPAKASAARKESVIVLSESSTSEDEDEAPVQTTRSLKKAATPTKKSAKSVASTPKESAKKTSKKVADEDEDEDFSGEDVPATAPTPTRASRYSFSPKKTAAPSNGMDVDVEPTEEAPPAAVAKRSRRPHQLVPVAPSSPSSRKAVRPRYVHVQQPKFLHRLYLSGTTLVVKNDMSYKLQLFAKDTGISIGLVENTESASIFISYDQNSEEGSGRSINMLIAIMRGIWVLRPQWLDSLLKNEGKIPKFEKYEIVSIPGPRASRLARKARREYIAENQLDKHTVNDDMDLELPRLVFSDWSFNLDVWKENNPTEDMLRWLVTLGAGSVVPPYEADIWFTNSQALIPEPVFTPSVPMPIEDAKLLQQNPTLRKRAFNGAHTKRCMPTYGFNLSWLRDSIIAYEAQNPENYKNMIEFFDAI